MPRKYIPTTAVNQRREADSNVAKVMGKGAYWLVSSLVFVSVETVKTVAKVIPVKKGK